MPFSYTCYSLFPTLELPRRGVALAKPARTSPDDIFFDFSEDDIMIVFDRDTVPGVLVAYFFDMETAVEIE